MKQENKNFLYNIIYQIFIYIFPLITIPYISRVLGADNVGVYSYTYSIINCLMLFSMLGINNYGNREISKRRDDITSLSKKFLSIYTLQLLCSFIMLIIYIIFILFFCTKYRLIFIFQIINFISVFFDINWFYFGLEKFKLTIRRNIIIKILSTILIFIFVKDSNDLIIYTIIMGFATLISQLYLFTQLNQYVVKVRVSKDEVIKNLKNCLLLFIPVLAYSIYRIMDKTMIGQFSTMTELGYYENAEKIINIPIAIITALGTVMLPRMSYEMTRKEQDISKLIFNSLKLALILSCNMSLGLVLISSNGAIIFFGSEFAKSGLIMQLLSVTIVISSWASVFRTQYLIPKAKDVIYVYSTIGGAIINLILNLIFIPVYGSIGACIGTIVAELFLCVSQSICIRKDFNMKKNMLLLLIEFSKALIIFVITYLLTDFIKNIYIKTLSQIVVFILIFVFINYKYIVYNFLGFRRNKK